MQCELDIARADDAKCFDDMDGSAPQHMEIFVVQSLAWCHHNRVTGMYADRIQVFHIANGDAGAICVTHDFIFDFLVAGDADFYQALLDGACA